MISRKKVLLVCFTVLLSAGVFSYLKIFKPIKVIDLADLVSANVFACISGQDIDKTWNRVKTSEIYSQIINSPLFADKIDNFLSLVNQKWLSPEELLAILGKDAILGLFLGDLTYAGLEFDVVLLSRISRANRVKEPILRLLLQLKKNNSITSQKYKGFTINTVSITRFNQELVYLILQDVAILSNSSQAVKEAVDLFKDGYKGSLGQSAEFKRAKSKLSNNYLGWAYLDFKRLGERSQDLQEAEFSNFNLDPITGFFSEFNLSSEGIYVRGWAYLDFEGSGDSRLKDIWQSMKNSRLGVLGLAPFNVAMFSAGNTGNLKLIWSYMHDQVDKFSNVMLKDGRIDPAKDFLSMFDILLGFDSEHDTPYCSGHEYGFSFVGFKQVDVPVTIIQSRVEPLNLSLPEVFGCIQIRNNAKTNKVMAGLWQDIADKINEEFKLRPEKENKINEEENIEQATAFRMDNYSGVNIYSLEFMPGKALPLGITEDILSPSYCLLGDYLVVSSNKDLARELVNVYQGRFLSLDDSTRFSLVTEKLQREFYNLTYINPKEYIDPLIKMFSSYANYQVYDIRQEEYKQKITKLIQVLDLFRNINAISTSSAYKGNFLELNAFLSITGI